MSRISHFFTITNTKQHHNSTTDCATELFKCSKDAAGLLVCIEQNWQVLDFDLFVGDVISGVGFRPVFIIGN